MAKIFNLIQSDLGRPIGDITSNIAYEDLYQDAKAVLDTLNRKEVEVQDKAGIWYSMRMAPYRTVENIIDGVVITFVDITDIKQADKFRRLATVLQDSNDAVTMQDRDGKILAWNRGAEQLYGYTETQALKMNIRELVPERKRTEALEVVKQIFQGEEIKSFETQRQAEDGRVLDIWFTVTVLVDEVGRPTAIATTERDITERKRTEEKNQKTIEALQQELEALKREQ
jgi:two-component system CheB/CheR fusion protein